MPATLTPPPTARRDSLRSSIPPLENGANLGPREFLRRYEAMPECKKAELIDRTVYMGSPVKTEQHGEPDSLVQTCLGLYAMATPGVKAATNSTTRLGPDDIPQPDGMLRILPEYGGKSRVDEKGYLDGAPDLVVEIAASSASIDVRTKLVSYRRARVLEYLVWRTEDDTIDFWSLEEDEFVSIVPDEDGILRSRVFPGLWLDSEALLNGDGTRVMAVLQEGLRSPAHEEFANHLGEKLSAVDR